ncbi:MAG: MFS transporter [Candidatus Bathyarchaeota archaeon]|nr:MFS transporter [Candidatus Bathyarchaeota archaeon]MDH5712552.1 MFS transporter [Candidatus Bathyarchaeota archaeon]
MTLTGHRKILRLGFPFEVLNKDLKLIFASNLAGSFGDGLYAYLLPYYMDQTLKASPEEIGILYAVMSLVAAFTLLVAGMFADRYDRKKIMIVGWIAWLPAPIIFSFAENWLQMLPGMILWGFWLGGPTSTAYITTSADRSKLTLTFTALSAAWSFGYIFSPALGGYLAGTIGMQTVFYSAFAFYALAGFILTFISSQRAKDHARHPSEERYSSFKLLRTRKLFILSVFFASTMFILMLFRPFVPQFLADVYGYGNFEIGVLGSVSFFGSAVLGILLGRLGDKWRKAYALAVSLVLCGFSLVLLTVSGNFPILIITFLMTGGSYVTWSLMGAIVGPLAPESIKARWISIPQTVSMFSSFIAPYIGGVLYNSSPYYPLIVAITTTPFLALLASTKLFEE